MKKIVIFKDELIEGKRVRTTLRSIAPSDKFQGWYPNGTANEPEVKKLVNYLEPSNTGWFLA